jgi:S-adenosylmethionine synthetase
MRDLNLQTPGYRQTAAYGHFGRAEDKFTWEKLNKISEIKALM